MITNYFSIDATNARQIQAWIINWAEGLGGNKNLRVAWCIMDVRGVPLATGMIDGTKTSSVAIADSKAATALAWGRDTQLFTKPTKVGGEWTMEDIVAAQASDPRFTAWGGGVVITHNGEVIGAVGVSGASEKEDHDTAEWAVAQWEAAGRP